MHDRCELTLRCLASLSHQDYTDFEVIVCDDGSTDGTGEAIANQFSNVVVLRGDGNLWWTGAINRCVEYVLKNTLDATDDAVVTLNNDLEVKPDYLARLADTAKRYRRSIISSAGCDISTGTLVSPGYRQSWVTTKAKPIVIENDHLPGDPMVAAVTHAAGRGALIPLSVFREVGLYDVAHLPHYGADYDLTHRAHRHGFGVLVSHAACVFSHVNETGSVKVRHGGIFQAFLRYLIDQRSPANLRVRWWIAVNNCPRWLLPSFLILDLSYIVGSFFKYRVYGFLASKSLPE